MELYKQLYKKNIIRGIGFKTGRTDMEEIEKSVSEYMTKLAEKGTVLPPRSRI